MSIFVKLGHRLEALPQKHPGVNQWDLQCDSSKKPVIMV